MIRKPEVFVIDDDEAVRQSLCWLMESADHPAKGYARADEYIADLPSGGSGCIVTDVRMPGISGIELLETLAARGTHLPVVVITAHGDVQMAVEAMKLGAIDFVEKPFEDKELLDVVERALIESERRLEVLSHDAELRQRFATLSPRERQVLDIILGGRPNRRVAQELGISEKTVEAHRAHIMDKIGATSFADLVTKAVQTEYSTKYSLGNPNQATEK